MTVGTSWHAFSQSLQRDRKMNGHKACTSISTLALVLSEQRCWQTSVGNPALVLPVEYVSILLVNRGLQSSGLSVQCLLKTLVSVCSLSIARQSFGSSHIQELTLIINHTPPVSGVSIYRTMARLGPKNKSSCWCSNGIGVTFLTPIVLWAENIHYKKSVTVGNYPFKDWAWTRKL